jgi:hypothetical protein
MNYEQKIQKKTSLSSSSPPRPDVICQTETLTHTTFVVQFECCRGFGFTLGGAVKDGCGDDGGGES